MFAGFILAPLVIPLDAETKLVVNLQTLIGDVAELHFIGGPGVPGEQDPEAGLQDFLGLVQLAGLVPVIVDQGDAHHLGQSGHLVTLAANIAEQVHLHDLERVRRSVEARQNVLSQVGIRLIPFFVADSRQELAQLLHRVFVAVVLDPRLFLLATQ